MRSKDILKEFEDITIFNQYLYMNEENYIDYFNGITTLRIKMNEDCEYLAINLAFPNLKPLKCSNDMTINFIRHIIENLKRQEPILKNTRFQNRWEEIKDTTLANLFLNLLKQEQVLESETNNEENRERVKSKLQEMISKKNKK